MTNNHTQERLVVTSQDDYPTGCANFESRYGVDAIVLYHDNAKADARRIVQCWNSHDVMLAALKVAEQFMEIASDWNMDEAEIDGEMRSTYEWLDIVRAAIAKATGEQP